MATVPPMPTVVELPPTSVPRLLSTILVPPEFVTRVDDVPPVMPLAPPLPPADLAGEELPPLCVELKPPLVDDEPLVTVVLEQPTLVLNNALQDTNVSAFMGYLA